MNPFNLLRRRTAPLRYVQPWTVRSSADCQFYHTMELPGIGAVSGLWDLRDTVDDYLGITDFNGKRALDIGAASGFLSFEMERRGADVVSFEAEAWEEVPYQRTPEAAQAHEEALALGLEQLKRGYWLAHRAFGCRARVYYGDIYNLPLALGPFDIAIIGMVLGHLRDPMGALRAIAAFAPDTIVIVEGVHDDDRPVGYFAPDPATGSPTNIWWSMTATCICRMLGVFGYDVTASSTHLHRSNATLTDGPEDGRIPVTTFIAHRKILTLTDSVETE